MVVALQKFHAQFSHLKLLSFSSSARRPPRPIDTIVPSPWTHIGNIHVRITVLHYPRHRTTMRSSNY